jgi:hypothetical protein
MTSFNSTSQNLQQGLTNPKYLRVLNKTYLMLARVPDLPKGSDNSRFGGVTTQFDPASEQLGSEPRNRSTTTPLVIDRRCMVDLAKKAKSLPTNREHTQEHKGMQPNCR